MNKYNVATVKGIQEVKGLVFEIGDYKIIMHDAIDNDNITISDYYYGVEIAESINMKNVYEKAKNNLMKLTSDEYNKRMKGILADNGIEHPVNEA